MLQTKDLRPRKKELVRDLVRRAGIDVREWSKWAGDPRRTASNPKYSYRWSFVRGQRVVLSIWFDDIKKRGNNIYLAGNMRRSVNRRLQRGVKDVHLLRAADFDKALQQAAANALPIRVIICEGVKRSSRRRDSKASSVQKRALDERTWAVTTYDRNTGAFTITRSAKPRRIVRDAGDRLVLAANDRLTLSKEQLQLANFARSVKAEMRRLGAPVVFLPQPNFQETASAGNRATIARVRGNKGGSFELWLDRFVDPDAPTYQACFTASTSNRVKEVEAAASSALGLSSIARLKVRDVDGVLSMLPPISRDHCWQGEAVALRAA